jgi:hypothetical protein
MKPPTTILHFSNFAFVICHFHLLLRSDPFSEIGGFGVGDNSTRKSFTNFSQGNTLSFNNRSLGITRLIIQQGFSKSISAPKPIDVQ